jgi:hypothetical protein
VARALRGGRLYDSRFGVRQRGIGVFADPIAQLFEMGVRRAGMNRERLRLTTRQFRRPQDPTAPQLALF